MINRVRRYGLLLLLLVTLYSVAVSAWSYLAFEQITVGATAIGFTTTIITPVGQPQATAASCRLRTAEVSYTIDGTTPTATVGTLLAVSDILTLDGHDVLVNFRAIRTGSSGQLDCTVSRP